MWELASVNQAQPAQDSNVRDYDQAQYQLRAWPEVSHSPTFET